MVQLDLETSRLRTTRNHEVIRVCWGTFWPRRPIARDRFRGMKTERRRAVRGRPTVGRVSRWEFDSCSPAELILFVARG